MSRPTVYATHDALQRTEKVPGSPCEYVLRLSHDIETAAAGELLRRTRKISQKRELRIDEAERTARRLLRALKDIAGGRPSKATHPEARGYSAERMADIAERVLLRYRTENPK